MINLSAAGLTPTESSCYSALLEKEDWKPSELAKYVNLTRTNCYKILDRLVERNLAERFDKHKVLHYRGRNPAHLLQLAREERLSREKSEKELEINAQDLINKYFQVHEQAGIRYFQGKDELKDIYLDQVKSNKPIYIIRPNYNMDIYDFGFMSEIRHMARKAGIQRYAITPDRPKAPKNYRESDPFMLLERTWLPAGDYKSPVEWNAYGDKVAIMSFGNEAIGMIIESPQIAESVRELYRLLEKGLRNLPGYDALPKHAKYMGAVK